MDAHEVLGVRKDATEEQVRAAYKALAMKWHPDRQLRNREEATAKFVEINKANRTMLRNLRRARRAAGDSPGSSVSGSSPPSPISTSTTLPAESTASTTSGSPNQNPQSSHYSSPSSFSSAEHSSPSHPAGEYRGRSASGSSMKSSPSSVEMPLFDRSTTSSTSSPKPVRTRLRKQSKSRSCRPDPLTGDYTPKAVPRRKSPIINEDPEYVVDETLYPVRSILRGAGADAPKKWVHVLNMTLEEIYLGKTFHFRIVRYKRSGKKSVLPLDVRVPPGSRGGTEIIFEDSGNERKDGTMQAIVFLVKELKHDRLRRIHDDLLMEVRLPWVDSLNEKEGEVHFQGVDGKDHVFRVDYCHHRFLSGTAIIPGAGMPSRDGVSRGRIVIRWEISSPLSSWGALKHVLRFKG